MENNHENETFSFTYSAKEQEEIKSIRKKYLAPKEDKMEQLRRLDQSVNQKAATLALIVGIIGALLLGVGMCCTMVWSGVWFIPGIIIGVTGIGVVSVAYPLYRRIIVKERERIAPEIIRLSDELMK